MPQPECREFFGALTSDSHKLLCGCMFEERKRRGTLGFLVGFLEAYFWG